MTSDGGGVLQTSAAALLSKPRGDSRRGTDVIQKLESLWRWEKLYSI
jgi:hypothetical protein